MRRFYAKVLLFGEYTILSGSMGLVIPLEKYAGFLDFSSELDAQQESSNKGLRSLSCFLKSSSILSDKIDMKSFSEDLKNGLFFSSNIPQNYGVGSSGAVIAAIFDKYSISEVEDLLELRNLFAAMEAFYHGTSSGIDPTSIYLNKPILIANDYLIESLDDYDYETSGHFYLLDTKNSAETINYVDYYLDRIKEPEYHDLLFNKLIPVCNDLVLKTINSESANYSETMKTLSGFQIDQFSMMIPDELKPLWKQGLVSDNYYMKLCGSGGGGFLLVYAKHGQNLEEILPGYPFIKII